MNLKERGAKMLITQEMLLPLLQNRRNRIRRNREKVSCFPVLFAFGMPAFVFISAYLLWAIFGGNWSIREFMRDDRTNLNHCDSGAISCRR